MTGKTPRGFMISAPKKSSGKTTITLGLTGAYTSIGKNVRVFKKGPDYIDPMWHRASSGNTCYNIDSFWMSDEECKTAFYSRSGDVDLCLLEGNHGLHDGLNLEGDNSGAHLAKLLNLPVLLVVDSAGMNRGVAAIVLGQQMMDKDLTIGAVMLNNVASQRQATKQIKAIEHYCNIPVIGAVPRSDTTGIKERHLGLVTTYEDPNVKETIEGLSKTLAENCDLDKLFSIAAPLTGTFSGLTPKRNPTGKKVKIGIAYDNSFCFYYPENLNALENEGAELIYFDTLKDQQIPDVDGIYIGGGFPESFLVELEENRSIRKDLAEKIESGLPVFAECGGLMYLTRSIEREGICKQMVGVIPADVKFQKKPVGKGYSELEIQNNKGWFKSETPLKGHEFHYSRLVDIGNGVDFKFKVVRGTGVDGNQDGVLYKNVLASYTHIHASVVKDWAASFVTAIRNR